MKTRTEVQKLINTYGQLRDDVAEHKMFDSLFDGIYWDAIGYSETLREEDLTTTELNEMASNLTDQIKAVKQLIRGANELNFIYC